MNYLIINVLEQYFRTLRVKLKAHVIVTAFYTRQS